MSETSNSNNKIPELLKILSILSMIGSGISFLSNTVMFFTLNIVRDYYETGKLDFLAKDIDTSALELLLSTNSMYFIAQAFVFAFSFYGVFLMRKLQKTGFHIYTIAQIILLIIPQVFLPELPFPFFELTVSAVFVTLYSKNLQIMK